jgi:hypothetical protein
MTKRGICLIIIQQMKPTALLHFYNGRKLLYFHAPSTLPPVVTLLFKPSALMISIFITRDRTIRVDQFMLPSC